MSRALALALRGEGHVEPNPMVGCVLVRDGQIVGEGFHERFGGPHAEVNALAAAGDQSRGATAYVTLEPCCHHGKTPPCTRALLAAGVKRVVVAVEDPFPQVRGSGIKELREAGIKCEVGVQAEEAEWVLAPYRKLIAIGRPWVIAKWAMTLDGKLATRSGDSKWISGEASRQLVHELRGRVDAIVVGRGTAEQDDPLLTARPTGPRVATRIVLDRRATLASSSKLVQTTGDAPVLVVVGQAASEEDQARLRAAGCEVVLLGPHESLDELLCELGKRRMTNVLVEGGATVLGAL